ncbi:MAG: hypothetical protein ACON4R_13215 [Akkermansiaceae bacterium]
MKFEIIKQRTFNVLSGTLAMTAQRLPFLKNLTPFLGAGGSIPMAAPLSVTFVGTHALSGQSVTVTPLSGASDTATVGVGEEFLWSFKSSRYVMRDASADTDGVPETLPEGLSITGGQSGIFFIAGLPSVPGTYEIVVRGYRFTSRNQGTTAPYTLTLTVEGGSAPLTPFEEFVATFWQGNDLDDPTIVGPTADPDEDGIENQLEFILDLDPTRPDTMPGEIGPDPQNPDQIRYEIPLNALANEVNVTFEETTNPAEGWDPVNLAAIQRTEGLIVLTTPKADKRLFRIRVSLD